MKGVNIVFLMAITMATLNMTSVGFASSPQITGCDIFPCDSIWNWPVDYLPVDSDSSLYVASIGASDFVHADFGSSLWDGAPSVFHLLMCPVLSRVGLSLSVMLTKAILGRIRCHQMHQSKAGS